ncbi:MAG: methionyl-tRNA formyltransferase [Muribaculaceae bacterium]|nr:methionyl-tRNA formyltransferase [Muribaculaceae bacterium]
MDKNQLRIVFFGTPEFAVESLDALVKNGFNIVGVVTAPDKIAGRGKHLSQSAVKQYALANNLPVLQPEKLKSPEFVEQLRSLDAQLFIVIAFRMLPEVVWTMPPLGTFNLHGSLLPRYRGAAPINRAVMAGETETGVTTFFLKHEIDTGDVLKKEKIEIGPNENAGSVHDRLMAIGAKLTVETVENIIAGTLTPMPQSELEKDVPACDAPKIFKNDCRIDWTTGAAAIHNHVRGLAPYPAAWSMLKAGDSDAGTVKILDTRVCDNGFGLSPGSMVLRDKKVYAGTADGRSLEILMLQPAGKRAMPADAFMRGLHLDDDKALLLY